eukprot:474196-Amphidinium_carterae.1
MNEHPASPGSLPLVEHDFNRGVSYIADEEPTQQTQAIFPIFIVGSWSNDPKGSLVGRHQNTQQMKLPPHTYAVSQKTFGNYLAYAVTVPHRGKIIILD